MQSPCGKKKKKKWCNKFHLNKAKFHPNRLGVSGIAGYLTVCPLFSD